MTARTLLIGLDSMEPLLMRAWMRAGLLPTLARITAEGATLPVTNFRGFGNGVYWPSLNTGRGPGEHGRYFFYQLVPGTYKVRPFDARADLGATPWWKEMDRRGARIATIDMVRTPLAQLDHGLEVVNWLAHDPDSPPMTHPSSLVDNLHATHGRDPFGSGSDRFLRETGDHSALLNTCRMRADWKTSWCVEQLTRQDWDLFAVSFGEAHDVGHLSWHLHDDEHAAHDRSLVNRIGNPLLEIYRHLDDAVMRLMAAAGHVSSTIVATGPGMERNRGGNHLLSDILFRLQHEEAANTSNSRSRQTSFHRAYHAATPTFVKPWLSALRTALQGNDAERDRARARYFAVPNNDNAGAVRINLRGREPRGLVSPGVEFEREIAALTEALTEITDASGARPVISEIVRVDREVAGPRVRNLPDLLLIWNRDAAFDSIVSPRIGRIDCAGTRLRTGDHSPRGEVIFSDGLAVKHQLDGHAVSPATAGDIIRQACEDRLAPTLQ